MSVARQANLLGQQRLDIPHVRGIESSIANDFDLLAGQIMAGRAPLIVSGFNVVPVAAGTAATSLQIAVANSVIMHPEASEAGTIFQVPASRLPETLNAANTRLTGTFTANTVNYIGIDLRRTADASTADLVQFLDADTNIENPKTVPLGRTLDYAIVVSTQDFSLTPGIAPLAKVTTDAFNNVASVVYNSVTYAAIEDARGFMFRLGSGGSVTNPLHAYSWPNGRTEIGNNSDFSAGDKAITSFKGWLDAAMTRMWELGGGEHWYSATADRNVQLMRVGASTFVSDGDFFEWTGTNNLHWQGLRFTFDNSTAYYNDIKDQLVDSTGLTNLADGDCIYVDIDRTTNRTGGTALQPVKTSVLLLGTPTVPGSRHIIAWRSGTKIFTRGTSYPIGQAFQVATTGAVGVVKLMQTPGAPAAPVVYNPDANNALTYAASGGNATALTVTGNGSGAGVNATGGASGIGVVATGVGVGAGVSAFGGATNGNGVQAQGGGTGGDAVSTYFNLGGGLLRNHRINNRGFSSLVPSRLLESWQYLNGGVITVSGSTTVFQTGWVLGSSAHVGTNSGQGGGPAYTLGASGLEYAPYIKLASSPTINDNVSVVSNASCVDTTSAPGAAFTNSTQLLFEMEWLASGIAIAATGATGVDQWQGLAFATNGIPGDLNNFIAFRLQNNATTWECVCRAGGVETTVSSGVTSTWGVTGTAPGVPIRFGIAVAGSGITGGSQTVFFFINGVQKAAITTNIPQGPMWASFGQRSVTSSGLNTFLGAVQLSRYVNKPHMN